MLRLTRALAAGAATALVATAVAVAPAAHSAERACPAEGYFIGDGWGADRGGRSHMGIDLGGTRGSRIFAIEDGVIDRTKRQDNGALQIVLQGSSGSKFYYGHMDDVLVKGGQRVQAGDVIGTMGDSGSPGAVHLHFEYWRSGGESAAIDPADLIDRVCAREVDRSERPKPPKPQKPAVSKAVKGDIFSN